MGNTSIIGEILMNPYISGQNSAKFGGRKFIDLQKQYWTEEGKNDPSKVGVRYPVQLLEDIKGMGAQWLSGRVLDSRPKGSGFEPHWRHCVVVLEQDTFILA